MSTEKVAEDADARTSPEAEQAVLGALLVEPTTTWAEIRHVFTPDLFAFPATAAMAEALHRMLQEERTVDAVLLQVELRKRGLLEKVVPAELPLMLARAIGTTANVRHYVEELAKLRAKRNGGPVDELDGLSLARALEEEDGRLEAEDHRIPTGWSLLDARLGGGFVLPSLNVLGAAPKSGKSTWAQIVSERHVQRGGVAYYLDLENGRRLFLRRLIARRAEVGVRQVVEALRDDRRGVFASRNVVERWQLAKAEIHEKLGPRLFVESSAPKDFVARIAAVRQKAGDRPLLVVIDSLQKLPMRDLSERRAGVDAWLRLLERVRLEQNAAVLLISEIKRGSDGYKAGEDAFKESGGIEYAADLAMTLTRPRADEDEDAASTLRVELARDCDADPRGDVATYRPVFPHYGLEELPVEPRPAKKANGKPHTPMPAGSFFPKDA